LREQASLDRFEDLVIHRLPQHLVNRAQGASNIATGHRATEKVPLDLSATGVSEVRELLVCLHALGRGRHAEVPAQSRHRAYDRPTILLTGELAYEGLIDLDAIEREAP
jgi:hypothetical protein